MAKVVILLNLLPITKKKFNTIEKINEFIDKSNKHYNKMVEIYEEETKQYKEVIY